MKTKIICILILLCICTGTACATTATFADGKVKLYNDRGSWEGYILIDGLKDIAVYKGSYLYAATPRGVEVYDVRIPSTPVFKKTVAPYSNCLEIKGIYLYSGGRNLLVYSLASPTSMMLVNKKVMLSEIKGMELYNNILYVSTYNGVVKVNV